jgi:TonB family protein
MSLPAIAQQIQIRDVPGSEQSKKIVKMVKPVYPPDAKAAGVEGRVRLEVVIGKDGTAKNIRSVEGNPELIPTAVDAVKQWMWEPTLMDGAAVDVLTHIDVNFTLADKPQAAASSGIRADGTPKLVSSVRPDYPVALKRAGIAGKVKMDIIIAPDGRVKSIEFVSGPPEFVESATEAVKQWLYEPIVLNGTAVEAKATITVNYTLSQ